MKRLWAWFKRNWSDQPERYSDPRVDEDWEPGFWQDFESWKLRHW